MSRRRTDPSGRNPQRKTSRSTRQRLWRPALEALEQRQLLAASVVINEIMFHPPSGDYSQTGNFAEQQDLEYIELFNRGDAPADLADWSFTQGLSFTLPQVTLEPGAYLVVSAAESADAFKAAYRPHYPAVDNAQVVAAGAAWRRLSNGGEDVELEDNFGARIDLVSYSDQGDWALRREMQGVYKPSSMVRKDATTVSVYLPTGDIGASTTVPDTVQIVGADQPEYNGTFTATNVRGYAFDYKIPTTSADQPTGDILVYHKSSYGLTGWSWINLADGAGRSLELINPALSNGSGQNWSASRSLGGTPGGLNTVHSLDIAPTIREVKHSPAIPKSTDSVTITAQASDELASGVSMRLFHRLDGQTEFVTELMYDDGLHGDGSAGDGTFGAILPPQANKTIVEFYVEAQDAGGQVRSWPAPTDDAGLEHGANLLYQVDDTVYSGDQPIYRLIIPQAEWSRWLNWVNKGHSYDYTDAQMNATFISVDGQGTEVRYLVGVRNRGEGTRGRNPHNMRINFPANESWKGVTAFDLNTQFTHSQLVGNTVAQLAGLPMPNGSAVQIRVNSNNLAYPLPDGSTSHWQFGSYFRFEPYGTEWVDAHFPEDSGGNIYKGVGTDRSGRDADLSYLTNLASYRGPYAKQTNTADDDWSDLQALTYALSSNTLDAQYTEAVGAVLDVDEWLRFFAVNALLGNRENSLGGGTGGTMADDYSMYRGIEDPRFRLLIHDMDTVLGEGDVAGDPTASIFYVADSGRLPVITRFLRWKDFAPRYMGIVRELRDTVFSPAQMNPLLDRLLGSWVPQDHIERMKTYVQRRYDEVGKQVPLDWSITTPASFTKDANGFELATGSTMTLEGRANAITTRSVKVNGLAATWSPTAAKWTINNLPMQPGLNVVLFQAFDDAGNEVGRYTRTLYLAGTYNDKSGTISTDTTWTAAGGPYRITSTVTVADGAKLTIEPGTTVFLASGQSLAVNGVLDARGTDAQRIRFTRVPGSSDWGRISIDHSSFSTAESFIAYADIEYDGQALYARNSTFTLDHVNWSNHSAMYVDMVSASFTISNSTFPGISSAELIHYVGMVPTGGRAIFDGNWFGGSTGYNDIIDFTGGQRPGPILYVINNTFSGGGDEALDLDATDAHIEGNVFMNFHQDGSRSSKSHAVSTGEETVNGVKWVSEVTIVGNLFYDLDHAIVIKDGGFGTIVNNTIAKVYKKYTQYDGTTSAIDVYEPRSGQWQGGGVYVDSNIFYDISKLFGNGNPPGEAWTTNNLDIKAVRNIFPEQVRMAGEDWVDDPSNLHVDPLLWNTTSVTDPRVDFRLRPGSPAIGAGVNGLDIGGLVAGGASISGVPAWPTWQSSVTLGIGGPQIYGFKYRLDEGPWSEEILPEPVQNVASLTKLSTTLARATVPGHGYGEGDIVRIFNVSPSYYNGAYFIRNVTADTFDFVVPSGTPTGTYSGVGQVTRNRTEPLTLTLSGLGDGEHRVEVLAKDSGGVWQAAPTVRTWMVDSTLTPPEVRPHVRINEVLAWNVGAVDHEGTYPDIIELYNDGPVDMDLSGLSLTDEADRPDKFVFPEGTVLGRGEYLLVYADSGALASGLHASFALSSTGGRVQFYGLPGPDGTRELLDWVKYGLQLADYSIGVRADGTWGLTAPTFESGDQANLALATGDVSKLKINEWLTDGKVLFEDDFIELYNLDGRPVDVGGLFLTDNPVSLPHALEMNWAVAKSRQIDALSFIAANGYAAFDCDDNASAGADHTSFRLSPYQGWIGLFDAAGKRIDVLPYGPQKTDVSEGRTPLGYPTINRQTLPTPGIENAGVTRDVMMTSTATNLFPYATEWHYYSKWGTDLTSTNWYTEDYIEDVDWKPGNATLGYETSTSLLVPIATPLSRNSSNYAYGTYYFRKVFTFSGDPTTVTSLEGRALMDDGAILYLNGTRVKWLNVTETTNLTYNTRSSSTVDNASSYAVYSIDLTKFPNLLRDGDNLLAVEVKQTNSQSSDIVWGTSLDAKATTIQETIIRQVDIPPAITNLMNGLRISEVMYDPIGGGDYEYIELKNIGGAALDLSGVRLTKGVEFVFPQGATLGAGQYALVVANRAAFEARHGLGLPVIGEYAPTSDLPRLGNTGEEIVLKLPAPYDAAMLRFSYSGAWYPQTNGSGPSLVIKDASAAPASWDSKSAWTVSTNPSGTPGSDEDLTLTPGAIVINEIMANTSDPRGKWIELFNTTDQEIDISGWYLSDDGGNLSKYQIPDNTVLGTGERAYRVFYQFDADGFWQAFDLAETGGAVYLSSANADGSLGMYRQAVAFDASGREMSFGRHTSSTGTVSMVLLAGPTAGGANAAPLVGPVIINEVMYNPPGSGDLDEYIELHNLSGVEVPLFDPLNPANTWKFTDGIEWSFPMGTIIPAHGYLVVTRNKAQFLARFSVPAGVEVLGDYEVDLVTGQTYALDNAGERLALSRPGEMAPGAQSVPYIVVDAVSYGDSFPWPSAADGSGPSLGRVANGGYGDEVVNWAAEVSGGSPGRANFARALVGTAGNDEFVVRLNGASVEIFQNGGLTPTQVFPAGQISALSIDALEGDDRLVLAAALPFVPVFKGGTGNDTLVIEAGSYALTSGELGGSENLALVVAGNGQVTLGGSLSLSSLSIAGIGRLSVDAGGEKALRTRSLSIAESGRLDLWDNLLIVQSSSEAKAIDREAVEALVGGGRSGGDWDGTGITSGSAAQDASRLSGLAAILNDRGMGQPVMSSLGGQVVGIDDILVRLALVGDTDLNGLIDASDYFQINRGEARGESSYRAGDFNYSKTIDLEDYALIDRAFLAAGREQAAGMPFNAAAGIVAKPTKKAAQRKSATARKPAKSKPAPRAKMALAGKRR